MLKNDIIPDISKKWMSKTLKGRYSEEECIVHATYIVAPIMQVLAETPFIEINGVTYFIPELYSDFDTSKKS